MRVLLRFYNETIFCSTTKQELRSSYLLFLLVHHILFWLGYHPQDMQSVEVVKDGKKQKMMNGRILVEIKGAIELDYDNRFEDSRFLRWLRGFYHRFILFGKIYGSWLEDVTYKMFQLRKTSLFLI